MIRWTIVICLLAVAVSLSEFAAGGHPPWWALVLDAWAVVCMAVIAIVRGFE